LLYLHNFFSVGWQSAAELSIPGWSWRQSTIWLIVCIYQAPNMARQKSA